MFIETKVFPQNSKFLGFGTVMYGLAGWIFWVISTLRQYLSLRERETETDRKTEREKIIQTTPPASTASKVGPCPTVIQTSRTMDG